MSADSSLFGDDEPESFPTPDPSPADPALATWQVEQLRSALDARKITTMAERQRIVSELAGRSVASLRELSWSEARQVADRLVTEYPLVRSTGSRWDDRDEDTWIDRL